MMSAQIQNSGQERQVELLQELVDCLDRERGILANLSMPELWKVMEEKNGIVEALEELPLGGDSSNAPSGIEKSRSLGIEIDRLQEEIRQRTRENVKFIQGSLAFVDGLIALLAGEPDHAETYKPHGADNVLQRGPIYRRKA